MAVINITKENFAQEVLHSEKPVLLDFWASWCGPCRMLSPVVDEVAEERTDVKVGKVNVDEQPDLAAQFGVMSIPDSAGVRAGQAGASGRRCPPQGRCAGTAGLNYVLNVVQRNACGRSAVPFFMEMVGINSKKSSTLLQMESQNQSKRKTKDPAQLSSIWQSVCRKTWRE